MWFQRKKVRGGQTPASDVLLERWRISIDFWPNMSCWSPAGPPKQGAHHRKPSAAVFCSRVVCAWQLQRSKPPFDSPCIYMTCFCYLALISGELFIGPAGADPGGNTGSFSSVGPLLINILMIY